MYFTPYRQYFCHITVVVVQSISYHEHFKRDLYIGVGGRGAEMGSYPQKPAPMSKIQSAKQCTEYV